MVLVGRSVAWQKFLTSAVNNDGRVVGSQKHTANQPTNQHCCTENEEEEQEAEHETQPFKLWLPLNTHNPLNSTIEIKVETQISAVLLMTIVWKNYSGDRLM